MAFDGFKGSVEVSSGLVGPNGRDIPLVHAGSIQVGSDSTNRLTGVLEGINDRLDDTLSKSGGTIEGTLTLNSEPVNDTDAANKQYVDALVKKLEDSLASWEPIA